jgi:phospholipase/carboxylesterase
MSDVKKLIYQKIEPRKKIEGGNPVLLLLHGRGTDENDLLGLAPYVDERFLIVSARAPFQFQWGPGYAWYDIEQVGAPDAEKFPVSRDSIVILIDEIFRDNEVNDKKLYLLGFSMGAVMASAVASRIRKRLPGWWRTAGILQKVKISGIVGIMRKMQNSLSLTEPLTR